MSLREEGRVVGVEAIIRGAGIGGSNLSNGVLSTLAKLLLFAGKVRAEELGDHDVSDRVLAVGESPAAANRGAFSADSVEGLALFAAPKEPENGVTGTHESAGGELVAEGGKVVAGGGKAGGPSHVTRLGTVEFAKIETTSGGRLLGRSVVETVEKEIKEKGGNINNKSRFKVSTDMFEELADLTGGKLRTRREIGGGVSSEGIEVEAPSGERIGQGGIGWRFRELL